MRPLPARVRPGPSALASARVTARREGPARYGARRPVCALRRLAALAVLTVVGAAGGGCASSAWDWADGDAAQFVEPPPKLPVHRAVERVTVRFGDDEMEFVGYRACDASGVVRTQMLLESGVSVLDVTVGAGWQRTDVGAAFAEVPGLAATATTDLARTWGSESVFGVGAAASPRGLAGAAPRARTVTDGARRLPALPVAGGRWLAIEPSPDGPGDARRTSLLDERLVPLAAVEYSGFGADGVPRQVRLVDLRDAHTLEIEVLEVIVPAGAVGTAQHP